MDCSVGQERLGDDGNAARLDMTFWDHTELVRTGGGLYRWVTLKVATSLRRSQAIELGRMMAAAEGGECKKILWARPPNRDEIEVLRSLGKPPTAWVPDAFESGAPEASPEYAPYACSVRFIYDEKGVKEIQLQRGEVDGC